MALGHWLTEVTAKEIGGSILTLKGLKLGNSGNRPN